MLFPTKYRSNGHKFINFSSIFFVHVSKHSVMQLKWCHAMEHFIPKAKPPCPSNIKDFRTIAL